MKIFLIILGVLVLLTVLICLIPVSIRLSYYDEFKYKLKIGFYELAGSDKKAKPKKKKKASANSSENKTETSEPNEVKKPTVHEIFEIVTDFLKNFKWHLNITVKQLDVYISCGDEDAAQTALLFGKMNAYAYTVDALLKSIVKVNESNINISVDYNSQKIQFAGETNIFARLGNILLALIRLLVYLINNKEKLKPILDYIKNKDGVKK